jgi:hypothetical protein
LSWVAKALTRAADLHLITCGNESKAEAWNSISGRS